MDTWLIIVLILFALMGSPLFAVFGAAAMLLFTGSDNGTITSVAFDVFSSRFADSASLVTIPFFTFAGYTLAESKTADRLVNLSRAVFHGLPGGLAMVCLVASAFFTTFTGGSGITIVAIGGLLLPALLKARFRENFSLGLVTAGGSLGLLFPPSIPLVLYGVVAGLLIDKLLIAGIIPGIITVQLLMIYSVFEGLQKDEELEGPFGWLQWFYRVSTGKKNVSEAPGGFGAFYLRVTRGGGVGAAVGKVLGLGLIGLGLLLFGWLVFTVVPLVRLFRRDAFKLAWEAKWELLSPIVLLFGIVILGLTYAAAMFALYVLFIEVFIYRDISIQRDLPRVIRESMTMLGAILAILVTALGFTSYLIDAGVPETMVEWMGTFIHSKWAFLIALNIFLLVVGMLMDIFSAIVVVVPLLALPRGDSIAAHYGINEYHLAIIFLLNLEIGYLTPPVGLNLFISGFRFKKPVTQLYRAVLPFIGILVVALIVTTYIEPLSTMLPSLIEDQNVEISEADDESVGGGEIGPAPDVLGDEPDGSGVGLDDLDGETLDDMGGETLDDLGGETLDDLGGGGETLDDLEGGGPALNDFEGETLDDLEGGPPQPGETLDDL